MCVRVGHYPPSASPFPVGEIANGWVVVGDDVVVPTKMPQILSHQRVVNMLARCCIHTEIALKCEAQAAVQPFNGLPVDKFTLQPTSWPCYAGQAKGCLIT